MIRMTPWITAFATVALGSCTNRGEVLRPADAPVVLHASDVRLSTGDSHACAVASGVLTCWGADYEGQLGVPTNGMGSGQGPGTVAGGRSWVVPAAGARHTCALAANGQVWCWGANDFGQLGAGDLVPSSDPRSVVLPSQALDLRTMFDHTCALLTDASLWCWGDNAEGQLGLNDQYPGTNALLPIRVGTSRDWVFVATGQGHGCGIRSPGALYCWGRNTDAQLGQGSANPAEIRTPTRVGTDTDWVEVTCGQGNTCARKSSGGVYCWGTMESGALAVGDVARRAVPARVPLFSDWLGIATNTFHTCGLRANGEIWCAGRDTEGQIGSPDLADALPNMQRADPNARWIEVRTGRFFTCARKADGSVWCLGANTDHQLATDPAISRSSVMIQIL
jgi:alpha-tubulin suppressor-like RCC1 family protein